MNFIEEHENYSRLAFDVLVRSYNQFSINRLLKILFHYICSHLSFEGSVVLYCGMQQFVFRKNHVEIINKIDNA